jgi:hypothetical protein
MFCAIPRVSSRRMYDIIYTDSTAKVAEHGGFAHDDTTVMMLVAHPALPPTTVNSPVETAQVAPRFCACSVSIR